MAISLNDNKILFAGDWHGFTGQALAVVRHAVKNNIKTIIQVGDFGIWQGNEGDKFIHKLERDLKAAGITCYFIDGNHENFNKLYGFPINKDGLREIAPHILHMPRGFVFKWQGLNVLALGGAYSVDKDGRVPGKSWWIEELINDQDVKTAVANAKSAGKIDLMITHDSPISVPNTITDDPISQMNGIRFFGESNIVSSNDHRKVLDTVYSAAKPSLIVHGHYHTNFYKAAPYGMVISLDEGSAEMSKHTLIVTPDDVKKSAQYATLPTKK